MKRLLAENDKVEFIKQVPLHPIERIVQTVQKLYKNDFILRRNQK